MEIKEIVFPSQITVCKSETVRGVIVAAQAYKLESEAGGWKWSERSSHHQVSQTLPRSLISRLGLKRSLRPFYSPRPDDASEVRCIYEYQRSPIPLVVSTVQQAEVKAVSF